MLLEKILRWKLLAEQYQKEDSKVFIKKINGDLHFCNIINFTDTKITVDNYDPQQRAGTRDYIDWLQIESFEEVKNG